MSDPDPIPKTSSDKVIVDILVKSHSWSSVNFNIHKHCNKIMEMVISNVLCELNDDNKVEVSLLLADDKILNDLNKEYRNKDKATNVLSFPFHKNSLEEIKINYKKNNHLFLGDIAISFERIIYESLEQEKVFLEYFSYILIHGLLHLLGYDHIQDKDAEIMEELEINIMKQMGFNHKHSSLQLPNEIV